MVDINDFNAEAEYYDLFEKKNQALFDLIVDFLEKLFLQNKAKTILDITCGTGAQAIPLAKKGFNVIGSDIGENMIAIARKKSKGIINIKFIQGDVRKIKLGEFDAAISILNSLGYLDKKDFKKALININKNLKKEGLLIFDNTNKTCLDAGNFKTDEMIDTSGEQDGIKFVRFSKSKYDKKSGIIETKWRTIIQNSFEKPKESRGVWKRQTYSVEDLQDVFAQTGFKLEKIYDRSLKEFDKKKSFSYLIVARKVR